MIEDRDLKAGTKLAARFKGKTYFAEVVETEDGIRYRYEDNNYKSLSSAGKAITSGSINGWRFWSLADKDGEPDDRTKVKETAKTSKTVVQIRKIPNQKGVPDGQVKYHCSACQKSFLAVEGDPVGPHYRIRHRCWVRMEFGGPTGSGFTQTTSPR